VRALAAPFAVIRVPPAPAGHRHLRSAAASSPADRTSAGRLDCSSSASSCVTSGSTVPTIVLNLHRPLNEILGVDERVVEVASCGRFPDARELLSTLGPRGVLARRTAGGSQR
jgi:hypothetical protein